MALSADVSRPYTITVDRRHLLPMAESLSAYRGSAIGLTSGYARALVSGDAFQGFCRAKADNSTGAAGDVDAEVMALGEVQLTVTGCTDSYWNGSNVYATADDTFTLTAGGSLIGKVNKWVSGSLAQVMFEADLLGAANLTGDITVAGTGVSTLNAAHAEQTAYLAVAALTTNADLATATIFAHPRAVTIQSLHFVTNGSLSDWGTLSATTTAVFTISSTAGAVTAKTFTDSAQLTSQGMTSLGAVNASCAAMAANSVLTLAITNGTSTSSPAGSLVIRYVPANA